MAISFEEWSNQKRNQTASAAPSTVSTNKQSTVAPAQSTAGATASSFEEWSNAKRNQRESTDINSWVNSANNLANQYNKLGSSWHSNDDPAYTSFMNDRSRVLANAQNYRQQYAGNKEALDLIDQVVSNVSGMSTNSIKDYYSNWGSAKEYNDSVTESKRRNKYSSMNRTDIDKILADTTGKNADREWLQDYVGSGAYDLDQYKNLTKNADFSMYSEQGRKIENPTYDEARGWLNVAGIPVGGKQIGNIVTFSRNNANAIATDSTVGNHAYNRMTDEEVRIYNYLLGKEKAGKLNAGSAQEYLDKLQDDLNAREGKNIADKVSKWNGGIAKDVILAWQSIGAGESRWLTDTTQAFTNEIIPKTANEYYSSEIAQNLGGFSKCVYEAGENVGNMIPSILLSYALGPAGEVASGVSMFVSAGGNAKGQALREGYSTLQANTYGALVGASCLFSFFGGAG